MESKKGQSIHPIRIALLLALTYILLCTVYIAISTHLAAASSDSLSRLAHIEKIKGILFVLTSGVLFFFISFKLLKRIEAQSELLNEQRKALVVSDRRAMAGSMAVSMAHDMNNQITVMQVGLEELSTLPAVPSHEAFRFLQCAVEDLRRLSRQLLNMGRQNMTMDFQRANVGDIVEEVIELIGRHPRTRDCRITMSVAHDLDMSLNVAVVSQMLFNLVLNAADATQCHGVIQIRGYLTGTNLYIEVHDNGPGIPVDQRKDVLKPFYTTKESGHGLGFVSVNACAEIHSGMVEVLDSDLGGCCIKVSLPVHSTPTG